MWCSGYENCKKKVVKTAKRYLSNRCDVFVMYPEHSSSMSLSYEVKLLTNDKTIPEGLQLFEDRLRSGELCYYVEMDGGVVAYGWRSVKPELYFYVWEIARNMELSTDAYILYDFWTVSQYRNRGIYKDMLRKIISDIGADGKSIIFAETGNAASKKAIRDVGFQLCGQISFVRKKIII